MPRKLDFDPDLVRINIRRKDHQGMNMVRRQGEPYYSLIQRIWVAYNTDKGVIDNENTILKETVQTWMQRALTAENQLERQSKLETY